MGNFNRDNRGDRGGDRSFDRRGGFGGRNFDRGGDRDRNRQMFKTTCSNCGKDCEVPFRPTNGKPVYCSDCFEKMGGRRNDSPRPERPDFRAPQIDQSSNQLSTINAKLDKILKLLEPKLPEPVVVTPSVPTVASAPALEGVKEVKTPKVKKQPKKSSSKKEK